MLNEKVHAIMLDAIRETFNGPDPDGDIDKMYIPDEFTRVFAKRLLKEAARVDSQENNVDHIDGATYNQTILEHFGINS